MRMMNEDETTTEFYGASDQTSAAKVKDTVEKNALLNISLGSEVVAPFAAPKGTGKLIIKVGGSDRPLSYDLLDAQGAKLALQGDGRMLFQQLMNRVRRKMMPAALPPGTFDIVLPISWSPGNLIVGTGGGPILAFGGGENYTADKVLGGISIAGIGFR